MTAIQTVAKPASGSPRAGLKKRTVESHRQFWQRIQ
jgi:hypothetical protein